MLAVERHQLIMEELELHEVVATEQLVSKLGVSTETIRRDLAKLESDQALERVHGGAKRKHQVSSLEQSYAQRADRAIPAKRTIAELAFELIQEQQTIVIDLGTTAHQLAKLIPHDFQASIATTSLVVAAELANRPNIELFIPGGKVRSGDLALSGGNTREFFGQFHADIAFLGSGGVTPHFLTDYHYDEIFVKREIISSSNQSYILADSSKLGVTAKHQVAPITEFSGIITDQKPEPEFISEFSGDPKTILYGDR